MKFATWSKFACENPVVCHLGANPRRATGSADSLGLQGQRANHLLSFKI